MAKYICSSNETKTEHARYWLEKNLLSDTQYFLAQSGYFSSSAIEPFADIFKNIVKAGSSIRLVLGSNGGSLGIKDAKSVFKMLKGKTNCSLTIVAIGNAEFHPKCYVITRNDGSKTAQPKLLSIHYLRKILGMLAAGIVVLVLDLIARIDGL